jgi:hypothetical protein
MMASGPTLALGVGNPILVGSAATAEALPAERSDVLPPHTRERHVPRYFFNVQDGHSAPDLEGIELPDVYTAQAQAIRMSGEILRDMGAKFWNGTEWTMEVADAWGHALFVLRFSADERPGVTDALADPDRD